MTGWDTISPGSGIQSKKKKSLPAWPFYIASSIVLITLVRECTASKEFSIFFDFSLYFSNVQKATMISPKISASQEREVNK